MPNITDKFWMWYRSVPPYKWALSYFGTMVLFSILFTIVDPDGFFHSTMKYEQATKEKERQVSGIIAKGISNAPQFWPHKMKVLTSDEQVYDEKVSVDGEKVTFKKHIELREKNLMFGVIFPFQFEKEGLTASKIMHVKKVLVPLVRLSAPQKGVTLFEDKIEDTFEHCTPAMIISEDDAATILDYISTVNGFPNNRIDSFWRMLYFSAATISTVGYGDITPLTTTNRNLIILEILLGILFAGSFLGSIAIKIQDAASSK